MSTPVASAVQTAPSPSRSQKRLPPDRVAAIIELVHAGHTAQAIAQQLRLPLSAVAYHMRKAHSSSSSHTAPTHKAPPALAALWAALPAPGAPWPHRDRWLAAMAAVTTFYFPDPEEAAPHE